MGTCSGKETEIFLFASLYRQDFVLTEQMLTRADPIFQWASLAWKMNGQITKAENDQKKHVGVPKHREENFHCIFFNL